MTPQPAGSLLDLDAIGSLYEKGTLEFLKMSEAAELMSSIPALIARIRELESPPNGGSPAAEDIAILTAYFANLDDFRVNGAPIPEVEAFYRIRSRVTQSNGGT